MIPVRQKTPDYCFVACLASALLDESYDKLQDLIVERFPRELKHSATFFDKLFAWLQPPRAQKIGVPATWPDSQRVVKKLGLAVSVSFYRPPVQEAIDFLRREKHMAQWIFINTNAQGFHLVRLTQVTDDGITVMDPSDGCFKTWDWAAFQTEYYALVVRDWK
jgi:hypothetical protein